MQIRDLGPIPLKAAGQLARRSWSVAVLPVLLATAIMATAMVAPTAHAADYRTGGVVGGGEFDYAVAILEPYVVRSPDDGTFLLDAPAPVVESVAPAKYVAILDGMEMVNGLILAGILESTEDLRAVPAGSGVTGQHTGSGVGILHHGKNEITCSWVNCTLRLDAFWTNKLVSALAAGAGAAGIASVLAAAGVITSPGAIPSGLAAGILALGSAAISFCSNSHGVWIRWGLGAWCGGQ